MKKKSIAVLAAVILCVFQAVMIGSAEGVSYLVDEAELLTESEETALSQKLEEISSRQKLDVVVVTVDGLEGKSSQAFADDYFDYNGYGQGADRDGILLLISMEERDWAISTRGYGIFAFTDAGLDYIAEDMMSDLSEGYYADAFDIFAGLCDEFITQAKTGTPYDTDFLPKDPFSPLFWLPVSLVIGLIIALIVVACMKHSLKSVRKQRSAENYVRADSMRVTERRDYFLYRTVNRVKKPEPQSSSSGSSTHTSSSGATHGGASGKF